jgi:tetratricopeptide (TPR) repeat protein
VKPQASKLIEKAVQADDWPGARRLIRAELKHSPKDHWLLSRLALTYYEQRKYAMALYWHAMALQEAPFCPLSIWGYAGSLNMLGRTREALVLYRWIVSWPEKDLAHGACGEGMRWARSLITDCHYRIAKIWEDKRQWKRALREYEVYLARRREGCSSIYSLREARTRCERLRIRIRH